MWVGKITISARSLCRRFSSAAFEQSQLTRSYMPTKSSFSRQPKNLGLLRPNDIVAAAKADWLDENSRMAKGPKLKTLPAFGEIIGPFRDGELTVFTGPTGTGKTTILSQISLDYAAQRIGTLWGSFEIQNSRLVRIMLQQISENPPKYDSVTGKWETSEQELDKACNMFSHLPLGFMDVHGSTPTEDVLESMYQAAELTDNSGNRLYRHIVLDNLQFMLSSQTTNSLDKFDLSDRVISALRHFATTTGVHVTLVIHPRKEADDTSLGLSSVSGTAKATQEADNVIILQKIMDHRYLDVKKNRFSGQLGRVEIAYNPATRMVWELSVEERKQRAEQAPASA